MHKIKIKYTRKQKQNKSTIYKSVGWNDGGGGHDIPAAWIMFRRS